MITGERMTFRMPFRWIGALLLIVAGPNLVLFAYFQWKYAAIVGVTLPWEFALMPISAIAVGVVYRRVRIPVVADADGVRFGWLWTLKWSDVTGARIRHRIGFRVLEITRRRGLPWRLILDVYRGLPEFLASRAPEGNPLRDVGEHVAR